MPGLKKDGRGEMVKALLKIVVGMSLLSLLVILGITVVQFISAYNNVGDLHLNADNATFTQLDEPAEGQEIAIVKTSKGEFRFALYREYAPVAVDNFIATVDSGYYNELSILSGVTDRYFICGKTESDGVSLEPEISENLWPFKGAVCAVTEDYTSSNTGNRILFVNSIEFTDDILEELGTVATNYGGEELIRKFIDNGGVLNFAGKYTVFGQVYEGMDVYEQISAVPNVSETETAFSEEVVIESIEISTYTKNEK